MTSFEFDGPSGGAPAGGPSPQAVRRFARLGVRQRRARISAADFEELVAAGRAEDRRRKAAEEASGSGSAPAPSRPVPSDSAGFGGLDGGELLRAVFDWSYVSSLNRPIDVKEGGTLSEVGKREPATILSQNGFLPVGVARGAGGAEELWVFVRETAFALRRENPAPGGGDDGVKPYVSADFLSRMEAFFNLFPGTSRPLGLVLVWLPQNVINRVLNHIYFNQSVSVAGAGSAVVGEPLSLDVQVSDDAVVRQARNWIRDAIFRRASDIHVEPMARGLGRIRIRVDGVLEKLVGPVSSTVLNRFVGWVKAQAGMPSESLRPLDGANRLSYVDAGETRTLDVRISSIPVVHGEKVVIRLLDPDRLRKQTASGLGLIWDPALRRRFEDALSFRDGIVLVTGPTGSGKTTTLNVALNQLIREHGEEKNIVTIEDPVEYETPGANQTEVNDAQGLSFADALRSLLRQDPDIMLVGEIRDRETATIAVQASLTGHLILATLHTNDALGSVARLQDLGITPFLVASTLRLAQAQRLVRRFCPKCGGRPEDRIPAEALPGMLANSRLRPYLHVLTAADARVFNPHSEIRTGPDGKPRRELGCVDCLYHAYSDRIAVMEMARSCPELVEAIEHGEPARELERVARAHAGFRNMIENGVDMIAAGVTSCEEVASVALANQIEGE